MPIWISPEVPRQNSPPRRPVISRSVIHRSVLRRPAAALWRRWRHDGGVGPGVFRDEIGTMTMKGFGEGVLQESRVQARTIRNAARFLTGEAKEGAIAFGNNDNRKTYNQTSSVNLSGNNFYVRDEQDIRSLAIEIATLTKRQQRGRGLRMA